jgi:hypothetical protein
MTSWPPAGVKGTAAALVSRCTLEQCSRVFTVLYLLACLQSLAAVNGSVCMPCVCRV